MHVISFDNLNAESSPLTATNSETFKVRFLDTGTYYYRCEIYTRMRGKIEVVETQRQVNVVKSVKDIGRMVRH